VFSLGCMKYKFGGVPRVDQMTSAALPLLPTPIVSRDGANSAATPRERPRACKDPARFRVVRPPPAVMIRRPTVTFHHSLRSALKEFFDPLKANNPRADFYAVYRKESGEIDRDNAKKYDEDLNTSLIFVSGLSRSRLPNADSGVCSGRFILSSQFSVHSRCSIKTRTGSE